MMYLLDTNVVSELRKSDAGTAHPQVKIWSKGLDDGSTFLSVVTVLELEMGVLLMERRDARQGAMLRNWMENLVLPEYAGRILPIDTPVALRCAALHVPNPRSYRDSLIAATALVHGMTLVTRNKADFKPTGVAVVNPWEA